MNSGWNDRFVQAVHQQTRFHFRKLPKAEREELTNDCLSVAWEVFNACPEKACPSWAAVYAVRRVRRGLQFQQTTSDLLGPHLDKRTRRVKRQRSDFELGELIRYGENPAVIAAFRELYRLWFAQLNKRQQEVVTLLAQGYRTDETAAIVGVTPGRVSQIRREVETLWDIVNL